MSEDTRSPDAPAGRPRHLLFLCVANSARSQIAEGIARSLAPAGFVVSSAGSEPADVRPEALRVLAEVGIAGEGQRSKGVREIEEAVAAGSLPPVGTVVTLCAEEVCPAWLDAARRIHWPLPDPAAVEGEGRLEAFRAARNELRRRIPGLFEDSG